MYCPNCYRMLPDDSKNCPKCGKNLEKPICINCGNAIFPGDKACRRCGTTVSKYQDPPEKTVDWVWGKQERPHNDKTSDFKNAPPPPEPSPTPGSWRAFCNDCSVLFKRIKNNFKEAQRSFKQYQHNNTYTKTEPPSAEYESVPNTCPSCGGTNISYQTVSESKPVGCLASTIYLFLSAIFILATIITPLGFIIITIIILLARKRTKTVTYATCQCCGHRKKTYNAKDDLVPAVLAIIIVLTIIYAFMPYVH